ncbi:MAG: AprI/Inh family metalloprotease inhibitor [Bradyrhizobium sp.]
MAPRFAAIPIVVCAVWLAACSDSNRLGFNSNAPAGSAGGAGPSAAPPPVSLAGRWTLSSTGTGSCGMTLGGNPDATEGTIAPGGGCPFNFFTSRKWNYTEAGLTIRDHNAQALAQLTPAGSNRFEGKTSSGQDVALSR